MKKQGFVKNNHAVAGVIEFLLIIALIAIILSMIQLTYIPEIMNQREADHMDVVENQFSYLKSIIDLQGMTKEDVPISSPITLGSKELPYFITTGARGELKIIEGEEYNINLDFGSTIIPLTSIKYTAINYYYLDGADPIYALEGGGLILKQPDGEVMKIDPAITVENLTVPNEINIYYNIPIIVGIPGKNNTPQLFSTEYIRTNYSSSDSSYISVTDVTSIKITTEYPDAWKNCTMDFLENNVNYVLGPDNLEITKKGTKKINFYYKQIYIYAQISPGWIK